MITEVILVVCILLSIVIDYITQKNLESRIVKLEQANEIVKEYMDTLTKELCEYENNKSYGDTIVESKEDCNRIDIEDLISQIRCSTEEFADERLKEAGFVEHNVVAAGSNYPMWYRKKVYKCGKITITTDISGGNVIRTTVFE